MTIEARGNQSQKPDMLFSREKPPLDGKVAIVTGGNSGIGAAIVRDFAREGVSRVYVYSRSSADTVIESAAPYGTEVIWVQGDIANKDHITSFVDRLQQSGEKVDILVNNAGDTRDSTFSENEWDDVAHLFGVNIIGPMTLTAGLLRHDIMKRGGSITNVSSIMGIIGNEGQEKYAATKAATIGFTKSLDKSLRKAGIRVNAVAPGFIKTKMTEAVAEEETARQMLEDVTPVGRLGEPEDVAYLVSFLSSEKAAFINGEVIRVDGGIEGAAAAVQTLVEGLWRKLPDKPALREFMKWRRELEKKRRESNQTTH